MPDFLVFTAVVPKLLGTKVILDMHDPMPELYMSKFHAGENNIFPVKLLEFIQMNIPVVVTKTKILSKYFGSDDIIYKSR